MLQRFLLTNYHSHTRRNVFLSNGLSQSVWEWNENGMRNGMLEEGKESSIYRWIFKGWFTNLLLQIHLRCAYQPYLPNLIKVGSPTFSSSFNQGVFTNLTFQIKSRLVHQPFLPKAYVVVSLVLKENDMSFASYIVFQKLHVILTDVVVCCVLKENDMSFASYCPFQKLQVVLVLQMRSATDV